MATRRRLTAIRLDKIAAVDKPCQEHATFAIVKRAPTGNVPPAIVKRTFDEALHAQLVSEKVGDVFWRAFENQWAVREAFRTAMTDEIADGGDGGDAVEGFTNAMKQIATLAAEAAREAASTAEPDLASAVEAAIEKWLNQEGPIMKYATKAALTAAVSNFAIAKASAQDVADIKESAVALGATDLLPADGVLAITAAPAADPEVAVLKRRLDVAEMAPAIRKHFDGLDETGQTAFLAKSATDRQAEIDAIEKGDPIVHTCKDGTQIRKSDGAAVLALAKRNDALETEVAGLRDTGTAGAIEKRARTDFPNVALNVATDMLKSVGTVGEDTDAGKAVLSTLSAMNKGGSNLFKSLGSTAGGSTGEGGDVAKARQSYDGKVAEIQKRDGIGRADAMSKARNEHPALFAEAFPDTAAAEAESEAAAA